MGTLNLKSIEETIIREYPTINTKNIVLFFGAIRETYLLSQKTHLILNRAGYLHSEIVQFFCGDPEY
ncbi:hypothetical protein [Xenorhabdus bovienii]|uniref:hypothetical protein n=1 Tax=Xenorhabdus bovienii TaxID=40576 RepID=UPI001E426F87|nr:hypothetical protein [Xenorhabdus bovienii]